MRRRVTPNLYMAPVVKRQNESRSARSADFFVPVLLDAQLIPFGAVHDCTKLLLRVRRSVRHASRSDRCNRYAACGCATRNSSVTLASG